ncbi:MAG: hypothetical protein K0S93_34 [Nitrososphaeraceae archaeon]|jgi:hypothetical protein|nr:hypothetical protein [Nitrososphaeraceae archaeon]
MKKDGNIKMSQKIKKFELGWYEDTETVFCANKDENSGGYDEQSVMKAEYGDYEVTVFEVKDEYGGYEYKILYPPEDERESYESFFESYLGGDRHAKTQKRAMEWATNTLRDILEEDGIH